MAFVFHTIFYSITGDAHAQAVGAEVARAAVARAEYAAGCAVVVQPSVPASGVVVVHAAAAGLAYVAPVVECVAALVAGCAAPAFFPARAYVAAEHVADYVAPAFFPAHVLVAVAVRHYYESVVPAAVHYFLPLATSD